MPHGPCGATLRTDSDVRNCSNVICFGRCGAGKKIDVQRRQWHTNRTQISAVSSAAQKQIGSVHAGFWRSSKNGRHCWRWRDAT